VDLRRAFDDIGTIFAGALDRVGPARLVASAVRIGDGAVVIDGARYPVTASSRLVVIGFGKASLGMARGIEDALGDRIDRGVVVTKRGSPVPDRPLSRFRVMEASHPVPDGSSLDAARLILDTVAGLSADDLVLVLISGGGSALVEMPVDGVTIADLAGTTNLLLRAGIDIRTLNLVRRRLSLIKGGGLVRAAFPARVVNLIISDVLGNPVEVIAGGPTVAATEHGPSPETIIRRLGIWNALPEPVRLALRGIVPSQPEVGHRIHQSLILADAGMAADGAAGAAREIGYTPVVLGTRFEGEAREFGRFWAAIARHARLTGGPFQRPACLIGTGELTVTVRGDGTGGRNTEMALAAALEIADVPGVAIASLATDGEDGVTGAAGGVVTGSSVSLALRTGLDPVALLENNDSLRFLDATSGLVVTGSTGTNVNDLYLVLIP
jgi:hydroxypyruvate reductase